MTPGLTWNQVEGSVDEACPHYDVPADGWPRRRFARVGVDGWKTPSHVRSQLTATQACRSSPPPCFSLWLPPLAFPGAHGGPESASRPTRRRVTPATPPPRAEAPPAGRPGARSAAPIRPWVGRRCRSGRPAAGREAQLDARRRPVIFYDKTASSATAPPPCASMRWLVRVGARAVRLADRRSLSSSTLPRQR